MESKQLADRLSTAEAKTFNRTSMESKPERDVLAGLRTNAFNRTSMESKQRLGEGECRMKFYF